MQKPDPIDRPAGDIVRDLKGGDRGPPFPAWLPDDVRHYLAHTGAGVSIRDLARISACHASTISRRVRRVEAQRDDPLVDAALRRMETKLKPCGRGGRQSVEKEFLPMANDTINEGSDEDQTLHREAARILRRMCENGAVMAIAKDMDVAVVVREGPDGVTTRTGVVGQETAQAMALKGWIETKSTGRILRYSITPAGRDLVKDLLEQQSGSSATTEQNELAEAPARFRHANDPGETPAPARADFSTRKSRYNLAESPLTVLARRRDRNGEPFLSDDLVRCGERLREDFELAQMEPNVSQNWSKFLTAGVSETSKAPSAGGYGPAAARERVVGALRELGPGLSDVALRCCCYLEGLENTEKRMGWSARSGKIVLRIALQRLKRHYDETLTPESQMIG